MLASAHVYHRGPVGGQRVVYAGDAGERLGYTGGGAAGGGQHNDACLYGGLDSSQVARADVFGIVKNRAVQIQAD